jgi:hypothetical protein
MMPQPHPMDGNEHLGGLTMSNIIHYGNYSQHLPAHLTMQESNMTVACHHEVWLFKIF